ncbi:MAG TPA: thioesterase, partial [Streptomyces sp.]|nr:thioesterase [Streptomyces sp.]
MSVRHVYSCPLRWSDMDAFGHVNNVVFLRYLEEARIDFMFRLAPGEGSTSFTGGSVVARHEIDYVRPLVHRHEPVTV